MQHSHDGLRFRDEGSGDPPLVFLHGWSCRASHFAPQVEHFRRSNRAVAIDLRGHGNSAAGDAPITLAQFARDVVAISGALSLDRPILVGHSMGGMVALGAAAMFPVRGVVLVDSTLTFSQEIRAFVGAIADGMAGDGGETKRRDFVATMPDPGDDPAIMLTVMDEMNRTPLAVASAAFLDVATWDGVGLAKELTAPILAIMALPHLAREMTELEAELPNLSVARTYGAGHFAQLLVPDQVNSMLERFIQMHG